MPVRKLTIDQIDQLTLVHGVFVAPSFRHENVRMLALEAEDADHVDRVICYATAHPKDVSVKTALERTRTEEPWRTQNLLRNRILESVPHDFLALEAAPDPVARERLPSDLFEYLGLPHDDPLWFRFYPVPLCGPTGPDCTWSYIQAKPALRDSPADKRFLCSCYRCLIREEFGPTEAWKAAFDWARNHTATGQLMREYNPLRDRVPDFEQKMASWRHRKKT